MLDLTHTPYRILRFLTAGGMAEVYLAAETVLPGVERTVVVKRLLPQHRDDDEYVTMFLDEARIGARITHPHVVELRAALEHGGEQLLVFEHVDGVTLRQIIDTGELSHGDAAAVALTLAETLGHVHGLRDEHGRELLIVHRDLNPTNVLVSRAGVLKIIDFGIARGEVRVHETATGTLKGTAGYMAPEQLREGAVVDGRADVFNLGILLYEMFVRQAPFPAATPLEAYEVLSRAHYAPPRSVRLDVPPAIEDLISRCLQADPERRARDMGEVAQALVAFLTELRHVPTERALAARVAAVVRSGGDGPSTPVQPRPDFVEDLRR